MIDGCKEKSAMVYVATTSRRTFFYCVAHMKNFYKGVMRGANASTAERGFGDLLCHTGEDGSNMGYGGPTRMWGTAKQKQEIKKWMKKGTCSHDNCECKQGRDRSL